MSEEKLYAVKNDEGKYWEFKDLCGIDLGGFWELLDVSVPFTVSEDDAKNTAKDHGGHVVELVEKPTPVVVSEEESKMLKKAKNITMWRPASVIAGYAYEHEQQGDDEVLLEERLMRAYVNGYTVAKEKKYNVKVPFVQVQGGLWFYINSEDKLGATYIQKMAKKFTMDEIEENGLQDCEKVEVEQDAE